MRRDNILNCEQNRSPCMSCRQCNVPLCFVTKQEDESKKREKKKNLQQMNKGKQSILNMQQTGGCWTDSSPTREDRLGWNFHWAYGAALSDFLLWHLTGTGDQRLLSNKLWPWDLAPTPGILLAEVCSTWASCQSKPLPRTGCRLLRHLLHSCKSVYMGVWVFLRLFIIFPHLTRFCAFTVFSTNPSHTEFLMCLGWGHCLFIWLK